jgi:7-carboxy-7-deazaguanine synthase
VSYAVRDIFDTFQGEGTRAGTRAVFIRFAACNMWNGEPDARDSGAGACAKWCDTDFRASSSVKLTADEICRRADEEWGGGTPYGRWVVLTGGEPMLQVDLPLVQSLRDWGFSIAIETNGTIAPKDRVLEWIDHVCVSPKLTSRNQPPDLKIMCAHELKVVLPGSVTGPGWTDAALAELARLGTWKAMIAQPQDPIEPGMVEVSRLRRNTVTTGFGKNELDGSVQRCLDWVKRNPSWRLGVQVHKTLGLP